MDARLACIRPDGGPHVIPVWQEWDGEKFVVIAWQGSQWAEYVLQNPNVSLSVDEPWPPLRRVVARGKAMKLPANSTTLDEILLRLSGRYLGQGTAGHHRTGTDRFLASCLIICVAGKVCRVP